MSQFDIISELGKHIFNFLRLFVPALLVILGILTTYRMIILGERLLVAVDKIVKKPGFIILAAFIIITFLFIWFYASSKAGVYHGIIIY